jgi:hypothetical protein
VCHHEFVIVEINISFNRKNFIPDRIRQWFLFLVIIVSMNQHLSRRKETAENKDYAE